MGIAAMTPAIFATANLPEPEKIRSTAEEVVSRSEFQLRPTYDSSALWEILWNLIAPILKFFKNLWDISPVLAWTIIVGLVLLSVLIVTHIIYAIKQAVARRV